MSRVVGGRERSILTLAGLGGGAASISGAAMGTFRGDGQPLYAAMKLPLFFLATWAITFPACHVAALLAGERFDAGTTARLVLRAVAVTAIALAGFATAEAFVGWTVARNFTGHRFFLLVQVLLLAGAGLVGTAALREDLARSAARPRLVLAVWAAAYGFAGSQWAWTLRPWIGSPDAPVQVFRWGQVDPSPGNFYIAVWEALRTVVGH